jgi:hypothetical protein
MIRRRSSRLSPTGLVVTAALAAALAVHAADQPPAEVEFVRVHVPAGRLSDVPLAAERHVPMPTAEFEQAVARFARPATPLTPRPLADRAAYTATIDDRGRLVGTLSFDLTAASAALAPQIPLGAIDAGGGLLRTRGGVGETVIFGVPDGGLAMRTPGPGTYSCSFVCPPLPAGMATFALPLVPALAVSVDIELPEGLRPIVMAPPQGACLVTPPAPSGGDRTDAWRIDASATTGLAIAVVSREVRQPRLRVWSHARLHGRQLAVVARVVPDAPWTAGPIALRKDAGFSPTWVRAATPAGLDLALPGADTRRFEIEVPAALAGTTLPIDVAGVADAQVGVPQVVPTVRPSVERWAGGGMTVTVDSDFAIEGLALEECVVVAPETAARWPDPPLDAGLHVADTRNDAVAARMAFEQQSAAARVVVRLRPRQAELDSARVTTVEMSPGAVLGRAACDVRVVAGDAFNVSAKVGAGWFIDSVEAVDWSALAAAGDESATADGLRAAIAAGGRSVDWRVVRARGGSELRVGLAEAATRSRALGLRITGHRRGMPLGGEFMTTDMDMIQLEGESAESAVIDFRVGPEAVIEVDGAPIGILPVDARLAPLLEPGSPRGRIRGGSRATAREARLVERRPPLDASVDVRLVARGGRLAESFTFTCRPDAGDVDAVVVHFSESLGDAVEWSLVEPRGPALLARRLDTAEGGRGEAARLPSVAESWLVEIRPAIEGRITFRAARTIPFTAPRAAPLAWVEGATTARATLVVAGGESARPGVVNRRLRELPPAADAGPGAIEVVGEFAYGEARDMPPGDGGEPALEIVPPDAAAARGWVWHEAATVWCHASGRAECEMLFDVENRGRSDVALTVPRGLRIEELFVDGEAIPFDGVSEVGGDVRVPLPPGRGRATILVRGLAERDAMLGFWRLDPTAVGIDVPVLARTARLMLPPDLDVAWPAVDPAADGGWLERLFDASARVRSPTAPTVTSAGFRAITVPATSRTVSRGIVIVRRGLVASVAIIAALASAALTALLMRRRPSAAVVFAIATAIAALWLVPPFDVVARGAWWAALAAAWWSGPRRAIRATRLTSIAVGVACLVVGLAPPSARAAEQGAEPYRVYLSTDLNGGVALVPEPLFRLLASDEASAAAVRVLGCRVVAGEGAWRVALDVDADRGGVLVLDQGAGGGRWTPAVAGRGVGVAIDVGAEGRVARVVAAAAGRHRVELDLVPAITRQAAVESAVIALPVAARSTVEVAPPQNDASAGGLAGPRTWQCERADRRGPWSPVAASAAGSVFEVSRAARVRLSRSLDPSRPLATTIAAAASTNAVDWRQDGCRVTATYDIDAGREIVRRLVIRAHPALEPIAGGATAPVPLGGGRHLLELAAPAAGRIRVEVAFRMPFDDAAGVFDVPSAWLEGVGTDARTVRCSADPDLDVTPEMPAGVALLRPREEDGPGVVAVWRSEVVLAVALPGRGGQGADGGRGVARVAVRRRPERHRFGHELAVEFAADHVGLELDCQIDATSPLVDVPIEVPQAAMIDRVTLAADGDAAAETVDLFWSRPAPTRLVAMVQRPRAGKFRLVMQARLPGRPAAEGTLPVARCGLPGGVPLAVTWRAESGLDVEVGADDAAGEAEEFIEVPPGSAGPRYVLRETAPAETAATDRLVAPETSAPMAIGAGVEATTVHVAFDRRGRGWGVARFSLASTEPVLRLRLPPGWRLFDVLVDGRETQAVPQAADTWDVRLHDIQWPRSLVAVFAGDLGARPDDGTPVRLEAPVIENLPCREILWTIDPPAGIQLRVAEPARLLDTIGWSEAQAAVRRRMGDLFDTALRSTSDVERERLEAFAAMRGSGDLPALEAAWERAAAAAASPGRVRVSTDGADVTIRAVRAPDRTTPSRGLATVALVAALAVGWSLAGRWPAIWSAAVDAAWPWAAVVAGAAWLLMLDPALPGLVIGVAGVLAVMARWRGSTVPDPGVPRPVVSDPGSDSTRTFLLP